MKYTYFGGVKSGKFFIRSLFQYNQKSYSLLNAGYIPFTIITKPCGNGYHSYEWNWENKFSHELKSWYEVRHLETIDEVLSQRSENSGMSFTDKSKFAQFPINLYKMFPRIYESDIVVNPLTSLGYCSGVGSREMNWNMRMRQPPMNVDLEYSLNELRNRCNILVYKENLYDWVHNFFLEGSTKVLEERGEDGYVEFITNNINESRRFEKYLKNLLEYYKIPYETFSLDTGDYCKTFGLSKSIDISLHDNRFTFLPHILREKAKTWTENYLLNH
tara:strand:+ start:3316 stop:4137 length:822 start_codon:yes stop_codon:yes gene_type:complete